MRNYNLKQEVDWREILNIMRWLVILRKNQLERDIREVPSAVDFAKKELENVRKQYVELRKFLRLTSATKVEREATELLKNIQEKQEREP